MQMNAIFHCKESQFEPQACTVEKIIELDDREYADFRNNMLRGQPFITEFNSAMRFQGKGANHCLLVVGWDDDDGVLIRTEGYDYARYAAFIPGARQILAAEEMRAEQAFSEQIRKIEGADLGNVPAWTDHVWSIAELDANNVGVTAHNEYLRRLREFGGAFRRIDQAYAETPAEIFNGKALCRPDQLLPMADWINNGGDLETAIESLSAGGFDPIDYAATRIIEDGLGYETANYDLAGVQNAYGLNASQMPELMQRLEARPEVGELLLYENRASFTLCYARFQEQGASVQRPDPLTQDDLEAMYARHLLWELEQPDGVQGDFSGQTLSGLDLNGMNFRNAIFTDATIHQCRMGKACFDDSDFAGAKLRGVSAYQAEFNGVNFSGATIEYSEFPESQFEGTDFSQAEIVECDGLDDISQGPAMTM